jgi:hypothetical protein
MKRLKSKIALVALMVIGLSFTAVPNAEAMPTQICSHTFNSCGNMTICAETQDQWAAAWEFFDGVCSGQITFTKK